MVSPPGPGGPGFSPSGLHVRSSESRIERVHPQSADADGFVPDSVDQVKPGTVLPADYPWQGGVIAQDHDEDDAGLGDDVKQSQRNGPARSDADQASKRAS